MSNGIDHKGIPLELGRYFQRTAYATTRNIGDAHALAAAAAADADTARRSAAYAARRGRRTVAILGGATGEAAGHIRERAELAAATLKPAAARAARAARWAAAAAEHGDRASAATWARLVALDAAHALRDRAHADADRERAERIAAA